MLSLYEILKASKTGIAPDLWTALAGMNWGGKDSGAGVKELTGIPPLSFTADGTPLLDYLISGNMSQNGTPTPDNPIQPSECGEKTENLFDYSAIATGYRIQWASGNPYADATAIMSDYIPVTEGDYALSMSLLIIGYAADKSYIGVYRSEKTWEKRASNLYSRFTVLSNSNVKFVRLLTYNPYDPITNTLMFNTGSTALPYEPYGQYKIPISSANTTIPVYLGEVQATRKIKKLVLTGEENISLYGASVTKVGFYFNRSDAISNGRTTGICSHFKPQVTPSGSTIDAVTFGANDKNFYFTFSAQSVSAYNLTDTASIKAWLAAQYATGTPVTVWYVLAEPETGIVNEPLRKIGNYADTLSMEQAGVEIPTIKGNTVIDVETTLKPSEMYIKYQE